MVANTAANRCLFVSGSSGTADFSDGTAVQGFRNLANSSLTNSTTYSYTAESTDQSEWEIGYGAYSSGGGTLARTTVIASSNAGSKVSFSAAPTRLPRPTERGICYAHLRVPL